MSKYKFKPGDYVRFLNEKQEGIIVTLHPNGRLTVDIEDGFPIDVDPSELVLVKQMNSCTQSPEKNSEPDQGTNLSNTHLPLTGLYPHPDELYFLVLPTVNQISSGPVQLFLVNTTSVSFAFTIHTKNNHRARGFAYGSIATGETQALGELKRDAVFDLGEFVLDALSYSKESTTLPSRIHQSVDLILPDIQQHYPQLPSPFSFGRVIRLYKPPGEEVEINDDLMQKLKEEYSTSSAIKVGKTPKEMVRKPDLSLKNHGLSPANFEVDLHIEELAGDIAHLSNAAIIQIQLKHFRKELDNALLRHAKSIVFIHGIGNGKLKSEIRKELKEAKLHFSDGAYHRYGAGATEVHLH